MSGPRHAPPFAVLAGVLAATLYRPGARAGGTGRVRRRSRTSPPPTTAGRRTSRTGRTRRLVGHGPIKPDPAHPFTSNLNAARTGTQPTLRIGNAKDPVFKPWAAAQMQASNDEALRRLALDAHLDGQTGAAAAINKLVEAIEAALRRLGIAQHLKSRPQFAHRVGAGRLDRLQRGRHRLAALASEMDRDAGLHLDEGDAVGQRVVQFAGDAQTFRIGAAPSRLLAGRLRVDRTLPDLLKVSGVLTGQLPCDARGNHPADEQEPALEQVWWPRCRVR